MMTCCTSNRRKTHFVTSSTSMMSTLQTLKFLNYFIILVLLLAFLFCVFFVCVCLFVHSFVCLYVHLSAPTQCITSLEGFAETLCLLLLFAHPDPSPAPFSLLFLKCQVHPNRFCSFLISLWKWIQPFSEASMS